MKRLRETIQMTKMLHKVPESVQQLIPVAAISRDGIFQLEQKNPGGKVLYDKVYTFSDSNFYLKDEAGKEEFLTSYCQLLTSLNVPFKVAAICSRIDIEQEMERIRLKDEQDAFPDMTESYNRFIREKVLMGNHGLEQKHLFIITTRAKDLTHARDFFRSIEANLENGFSQLESTLTALDANARMQILYDYYHLGENGRCPFDYDHAISHAQDFRDLIAPGIIREYQDEYGTHDGITLQVGDRYMRTLYLPKMPNGIDPDSLGRLYNCGFPCAITVDVQPIAPEVAKKNVINLYMQNGRKIEKQQEHKNRNGQFSSDISYEARREHIELEDLLNQFNNNNTKLYYAGVYAVISAGSKKELENRVNSFLHLADGENFSFRGAVYEQVETFHTAAPLGVRFVSMMQTMLTQPLSGLTPFVVHELRQEGGILYGINQVSRNVIIGDRKRLLNGNGLITGTSGSGKSMGVKTSVGQILINTKDDVIMIDPSNEYRALAEYYKGQYIDLSSASKHTINPLGIENFRNGADKTTFLRDKTMMMLSIFSQLQEDTVQPEDRSLIGRAIQIVYKDLGRKGFVEPTFVELYEALRQQPEERAHQLALSMELFVKGPLDMFAKPTNINIRSRFTVFGMENLDSSQNGIYIIIVLEFIRSRNTKNAKEGKCTDTFIDELHRLRRNEYSMNFLSQTWREVRKLGGICTGITQNIGDLLSSPEMAALLCNSEFLMLYNHKEAERELIQNELGIPASMLRYITNPPCGCGLLKFGEKLIPFDGRLPTDSEMYRMYNTNFHEIARMRQKLSEKEQRPAAPGKECMKDEIPDN